MSSALDNDSPPNLSSMSVGGTILLGGGKSLIPIKPGDDPCFYRGRLVRLSPKQRSLRRQVRYHYNLEKVVTALRGLDNSNTLLWNNLDDNFYFNCLRVNRLSKLNATDMKTFFRRKVRMLDHYCMKCNVYCEPEVHACHDCIDVAPLSAFRIECDCAKPCDFSIVPVHRDPTTWKMTSNSVIPK